MAPSMRLAEIGRARRKRPESLDAYDLVLQALPYVSTRRADDATKAIPLIEQALTLDRLRLCGSGAQLVLSQPISSWRTAP